MGIFSFFSRLFRRVVGLEPEARSGFALARRGADWFAGDSGSTIRRACPVAVYRRGPGLAPAVAVPVRYRVIGGPFEFEGGRRETVTLTDENGMAAIDIRMTGRGAGLVDARLDPVQARF